MCQLQKNPGTIRNPEDDLGREQLQMDMSINLERASRISKHIRDICSEARTTTYTREEDLKLWSKGTRQNADAFDFYSGLIVNPGNWRLRYYNYLSTMPHPLSLHQKELVIS